MNLRFISLLIGISLPAINLWAAAPLVTTLEASTPVGPTAILNGSAGANGAYTQVYFQLGPTTSYGSVLPVLFWGALDFADRQIVSVPSPAVPVNDSSYTIEAWIKPDRMGNLGIVGWGVFGEGLKVNALRLSDQGLVNYWWDRDLAAPTPSLAGAWHHVAAAFDGTTRALYLDGELVGHDAPGKGHVVQNTNFRIGVTSDGEYFDGKIAEVRIWSSGLSQATLKQWMSRSLTSSHPAYASLKGYWPLDEGAGKTVLDRSGNGASGTLAFNPDWTDDQPIKDLAKSATVSTTARNLIPSTTYHFRLAASNSAGTTFGKDLTFATRPPATFYVSNLNDSGAGSLRQALLNVNAETGFGMIDATGVSGTIRMASMFPVMSNSFVLNGSGANRLTVSGNNLYRVLFIDSPDGGVKISNLTIAHGRAKGGNGGAPMGGGGGGLGGGLFVNRGNVTVASVTFVDNAAIGGNGAGGGGNTLSSGGGGGLGGDGGSVNPRPGPGNTGVIGGGGGGGFSGHGGMGFDGGGGGGGILGDGGNGGWHGGGGGGGGTANGELGSSYDGGTGGGGGGHGGGDANRHGTDGVLYGGGGGGGNDRGQTSGNGGNGGRFGGGGGAGGGLGDYPTAGDGGEFGGGGGLSIDQTYFHHAGVGGFGGGGGGGGTFAHGGASAAQGGAGGFGGGGGGSAAISLRYAGAGGAFGGRGGTGREIYTYKPPGGGGGGAALGGSVFVRSDLGASITFADSSIDAGSIQAGAGGANAGSQSTGYSYAGDPGRTAGSAIFLPQGITTFIVNSQTNEITGSIGDWDAAPGSISKYGGGTLVMGATNTYHGVTRVEGGVFELRGDISSSSAVIVSGGGTLSGNGVAGSVTISDGGTLSPGSGIGIINLGNTVWSGAGHYNWQVRDATGREGIAYDSLHVQGALDVGAAAGFVIHLASVTPGSSAGGLAGNFDATRPYSWLLARATGGIRDFDSSKFTISTQVANGSTGFLNPIGSGSFHLRSDGYSMVLDYRPNLPALVSTVSTSVSGPDLILNGLVNPRGVATEAFFEYGTTTSYGSLTSPQKIGWGSRSINFHHQSVRVDAPKVPTGNSPYTIEVWIKPAAMGVKSIVGWGDYGYGYRVNALRLTDNGLLHFWWGGDLGVMTGDLRGVWHHIAATYDGTIRSVYLDGLLKGQDRPAPAHNVSNNNFRIGTAGVGLNEYFEGQIAEVRVWNTSLNSGTLQDWLGRTVDESHPYYSNLEGYWPLAEGSGSSIKDYSSNANNGILTDTPDWQAGVPFINTLAANTLATNALINARLSNLMSATTYHYRLVATNQFGTINGSDLTFTTPAAVPVIESVAVASRTASGATINGLIHPNGDSTTVWLQYGSTTNYGQVTSASMLRSTMAPESFQGTVSGLVPGTAYHARLVASNMVGTALSADLRFTTSVAVPVVLTGSISNRTPTSVQAGAYVNPGGGPTLAYFEYGLTTEYAHATTPTRLSGVSTQPVSGLIANLVFGAGYHIRAAASNEVGIAHGDDVFIPPYPTAVTLEAAETGETNTVLRARINPGGTPTTVGFQYGLTTNYGHFSSVALAGAASDDQSVSIPVTGLQPATVYHFAVFASNHVGLARGGDMTVVTRHYPPSAITLPASQIVGSSATLNGSINRNGAETQGYFRYGTTTNYGGVTLAQSLSVPSGSVAFQHQSVLVESLETPTGNSHYTIEAWIKPASMGIKSIIGWGDYGQVNRVNALRLTDRGLLHFWWGNDLEVVTGDLRGAWHHVAATFDGTTRMLYLDGVLKGQDRPGNSHNVPNHNFRIGTAGVGLGEYFDGQISEVRVWNTNVDQLTLQGWLGQSLSRAHPYYAHLEGYWPMDEGSGAFIKDHGTHGNNGLLLAKPPVWKEGPPIINRLGASNLISAHLDRLSHTTDYHFQLVASNQFGISEGADLTLTTPALAPVIESAEVIAKTSSNVTLNGLIHPNGDATTVWLEYGLSTNYGHLTSATMLRSMVAPGSFQGTISGLLPGTAYHTRLVASNLGGTISSADLRFTTLVALPVVITGSMTHRTPVAVQAGAEVNPGGGGTVAYFEYGVTGEYGQITGATNLSGVNTQPIFGLIANLVFAAGYHIRAVASNEVGVVYGDDAVIPPYPTAVTLEAVETGETNSVLRARINPEGALTTVWFQYGLTTNYGTLTAVRTLGPTSGDQAISLPVTGLQPAAAYHFAVFASNQVGLARGGDMTLLTRHYPPLAMTLPASQIVSSSATLNGSINRNGAETKGYFRYGNTTNYDGVTPAELISNPSGSVSFQRQSVRVESLTMPAGNAHYTIEAWIKPASMGVKSIIGWGEFGQVNRVNALRLTDRGLLHFWWGNDLEVVTGDLRGAWHHVAATFDGTTRSIYLDGVLKGQDHPGHSHNVPSHNFRIGTAGVGLGEYFDGQISEVRVWNTSLDQLTLQEWRGQTLRDAHPYYAYLKGYWPMDDGSGNFIKDHSTHGNHGVLTAAPVWSEGPPVNNLLGTNHNVTSARVTGLNYATAYHFQLVASNQFGVSEGADLTFTTPALAPTAITLEPQETSQNRSVLRARVNPNGSPTKVWFEFGLTTNYGNFSGETVLELLREEQSIEVPITGLQPGSTYHFAVVASNLVGVAKSGDLTLNTAHLPPTATTQAANEILRTAATLNGLVNANGAEVQAHFRYGLTTNYGTATPSQRVALPPRSVLFQGNSMRIDDPNIPTKDSQYTIEAWIKPAAMGVKSIIGWGEYGQNNSVTALRLTDHGLLHFWWANDLEVETGDLRGAWHHVAATFDGTTRALYLDGALKGQDQPRAKHTVSNNNFRIGTAGVGLGEYFDGEISEVRIWNTSMDPVTLRNWLGRTLNETHPYYSHLQGYWPIDEGFGDVIHDYSSNDNTGLLTAPPIWSEGPLLNSSASIQINGLEPHSLYHFQIVASNLESGEIFGDDLTFYTPEIPSIVAESASAITETTVLLSATVNPNESATKVFFDFGFDTSYGVRIEATNLTDRSTIFSVSSTIIDLLPNTVYHYRAFTTNIAGVESGEDRTFTTLPVVATIAIQEPASISDDRVTFYALVNPRGADTTVHVEFGATSDYGQETSSVRVNGSFNQPVSLPLENLPSGQYLYYRMVASNIAGTVLGEGQSLLTAPSHPWSQVPIYSFSATDRFGSNSDGANPEASLIQNDAGVFYGVTPLGGDFGKGTLFKVSENQFQNLAFFRQVAPIGGIVRSSLGEYFGVFNAGYRQPSGFRFVDEWPFPDFFGTSAFGAFAPGAGLVEAADGRLYGTFSRGGIYSFSTAGQFSLVHLFSAPDPLAGTNEDGANIRSVLIQDRTGRFYGTASKGGLGASGTVFAFVLGEGLSTLHSFERTDASGLNRDGANPIAGVIQTREGLLCGVTSQGGTNGNGTVFGLSTNGTFTLIHTFGLSDSLGRNLDGMHPEGALVQGADGALYGVTVGGGVYGRGAAFQITADGQFTTLYSFAGSSDGARPRAALIQAQDGHFYGTASAGGAHDTGAIFELLTPKSSATH